MKIFVYVQIDSKPLLHNTLMSNHAWQRQQESGKISTTTALVPMVQVRHLESQCIFPQQSVFQ